jgi:hypothetical protein
MMRRGVGVGLGKDVGVRLGVADGSIRRGVATLSVGVGVEVAVAVDVGVGAGILGIGV